MQTLYEDFLKTGGNWKKGIVWKEVIQKRMGKSRGVRKWLTKSQLTVHFDDAKIAAAVIERKTNSPDLAKEIRDHPNLPGRLDQVFKYSYVHVYLFHNVGLKISFARPEAISCAGRGRRDRRRREHDY